MPNWTVRALLRAQYSNAVCICCEIVRRIVPIVALALAPCSPQALSVGQSPESGG